MTTSVSLRSLGAVLMLLGLLVPVSVLTGSVAASAGAQPTFIFVNENPMNAPNEVRVYKVMSSGGETLVGNYLTQGSGASGSMLVAEREDVAHMGNHLYAINLGDLTISVFSINPVTGALTLQQQTGALGATSIVVSPSGTVMYAGGSDLAGSQDTLTSYALGPNGTIGAEIAQVPAFVDGMAVSPDGTEVAAAYPNNASPGSQYGVTMYPTDSAGHIMPDSFVQVGCPTDVRFSPDSKSLYSAGCPAGGGALTSFSTTGGVLTQTGSSPTASQTLAVGPDGAVYFDTALGLQGARVSPQGVFTLGPATPDSPYNSADNISSLNVSPDGSQFFVAGFRSTKVDAYAIGSNHALSLVTELPIQSGLPTVTSITEACPGDPDPSGATCIDQQNTEVNVNPGSLTITTPYTASNPFQMPALALNSTATLLTATAPFPAASDPSIRVHSSLAGNPNWTVSVTSTDLACQSGPCTIPIPGEFQSINGQNLGLTSGATTTPTPNGSFPGTVSFTNVPAASGVDPGTPGSLGLKGGPHTFAVSAGGGDGVVDMDGVLSVTAPTATQAGTYTGTITFTVG
jgi:6-phosphogluconolactonase (cycloisomerase 2 family)